MTYGGRHFPHRFLTTTQLTEAFGTTAILVAGIAGISIFLLSVFTLAAVLNEWSRILGPSAAFSTPRLGEVGEVGEVGSRRRAGTLRQA